MFSYIFFVGMWTTNAGSRIGVENRNTGANPNLEFASKHCNFAQYRWHRFHQTMDGIQKPTTTPVWHVHVRLLTPSDSQVLKDGQFPHALRDGATQYVLN